jgi:DNA-binding transcriptional LysR family regulator
LTIIHTDVPWPWAPIGVGESAFQQTDDVRASDAVRPESVVPDREILTLIPVFDAILSEGSISRAADRLGVTQSAVSQALARLRRLAKDDLFESTGHGMRPTPRALDMASHVRAALLHANAAFSRNDVELEKLERTFVLDIGGGFDALIVPVLLGELRKRAPRVRLLISNTRGRDLLSELKYGETELAFDFQDCVADGIKSDLLGKDAAVVLARPNHPALAEGMTEELYFGLPHAALVWARATAMSGVALELDRMGSKVRVEVSVPTLSTLGAVVASSDLIATTSAFAGRWLTDQHQIEVHPMPFSFPPLLLFQLWHLPRSTVS